jgi:hypothetical protein
LANLLRILRLLVLLLLLVVLFATAKEPAKKAAFLGFRLLLVTVLGVLGVGIAGLLRLAGGQDGGTDAWRKLLLGCGTETKELLEEIPLVVIGVGAGVSRDR